MRLVRAASLLGQSGGGSRCTSSRMPRVTSVCPSIVDAPWPVARGEGASSPGSVKTRWKYSQSSSSPLRRSSHSARADHWHSVSSMKLHRDIGVSQKTAWFMLMRIREAWAADPCGPYSGPVEFDEAYFGGQRKNMSNAKRRDLTGRGPVGKTAVVGAKDRASNQVTARVVQSTDADTLQGFVTECPLPDATVYTDDSTAYKGVPRKREAVRHSVGEYVKGQASTNGIESFWSMLKRAHKGTFHKLSPHHLDRYVREFAGRHTMREPGTLEQMRHTVARLMGRNLLSIYRDLVADNGLSSGAHS